MLKDFPKNFSSCVFYFLRPHKKVALLFIFLAFSAGFWGPFNSLLIKRVIDLLVAHQAPSFFSLGYAVALIVMNFIIFDNVTWRTIGYINYRYQGILKNQIITELMAHMLGLSHHYFQENLSGKLAHHVMTLAQNLERIVCRMSPDFIRAAALVIVSFTTSFMVSPLFCLILFLWFLSFCSFSIFMSQRLARLSGDHATQESFITGTVVDVFLNHASVRSFSRIKYELSRLNIFLDRLLTLFKKKEGAYIVLATVQGGLIATMMAATVITLAYYYSHGLIGVGDVTLMIGLSMELGHTIWHAMDRVEEFNQAYGACAESLAVLGALPEVYDMPQAVGLVCSRGEISFDHVTFGYPQSKIFFNNLSVVIKPGEKVGLVGYSGAGKSTFVHLIQRMYDLTAGQILIDGQDVKYSTQESLRKNIALIPQDPQLFHRSIRDNLCYANLIAHEEDMVRAAQRAHAHDFIIQLPDGYDALVGERGVKLSGGQRQRIALARAFLKNAPILILDEATSQLDSITEQLIQESLWELMSGKTTLIIAHRLSTLMTVDRILVFDQGVIVQDGSHQKLLAEPGLYKKLWETQVEGFIG